MCVGRRGVAVHGRDGVEELGLRSWGGEAVGRSWEELWGSRGGGAGAGLRGGRDWDDGRNGETCTKRSRDWRGLFEG